MAKVLATKSVPPPGANGTITLMGRSGYWAETTPTPRRQTINGAKAGTKNRVKARNG